MKSQIKLEDIGLDRTQFLKEQEYSVSSGPKLTEIKGIISKIDSSRERLEELKSKNWCGRFWRRKEISDLEKLLERMEDDEIYLKNFDDMTHWWPSKFVYLCLKDKFHVSLEEFLCEPEKFTQAMYTIYQSRFLQSYNPEYIGRCMWHASRVRFTNDEYLFRKSCSHSGTCLSGKAILDYLDDEGTRLAVIYNANGVPVNYLRVFACFEKGRNEPILSLDNIQANADELDVISTAVVAASAFAYENKFRMLVGRQSRVRKAREYYAPSARSGTRVRLSLSKIGRDDVEYTGASNQPGNEEKMFSFSTKFSKRARYYALWENWNFENELYTQPLI